MSISPDQLSTANYEKLMLQSAPLERVIDSEMRKNASDIQNGSPVLIKLTANISDEIRNFLVKRYQNQGWVVEIIQARGGECLKITQAKAIDNVLEDVRNKVASQAKKFLKLFSHEHNKTS